MFRGVYAAASGMQVASEQQDVTAYNLAHQTATGYKQRGVRYETFDQALGRAADATGDLTGSRVAGAFHDFRPGALRETGNRFDFALSEPDQFFALNGPNGPVYTRNGSFHLTAAGDLVSGDGYPVLGENGPVTVPPDATRVTVGTDGSVFADGDPVGRIRVGRFADLGALTAAGPSLYAPPAGTNPAPVAEPKLVQGYLEGSNVDPADAMVRMIVGARYYEAAQRALRAMSESIQLNTRPQG